MVNEAMAPLNVSPTDDDESYSFLNFLMNI